MMEWVKNEGQFHPGVAWVAPNARQGGNYQGAGPVTLHFQSGEWNWRYCSEWNEIPPDDLPAWWSDHTGDGEWPDAAWREAHQPNTAHATASAGEIVVDHGTAAAALLNAIEGRNR